MRFLTQKGSQIHGHEIQAITTRWARGLWRGHRAVNPTSRIRLRRELNRKLGRLHAWKYGRFRKSLGLSLRNKVQERANPRIQVNAAAQLSQPGAAGRLEGA